MSTQGLTTVRELDHRTTDGIDIRLLWCEREDRVMVAVNDAREGRTFCLDVPERHRALDVFHHPFAYA